MPRDNALFTLLRVLTVCLDTAKLHVCMLWLTMVLQNSAISRRTIAIELLRRFDQMEREGRHSCPTQSPHRHFADATRGIKQPLTIRSESRGCFPTCLTTHTWFPAHQHARKKPTRNRTASRSRDISIVTSTNNFAVHTNFAPNTRLKLTPLDSAHSQSSRSAWNNDRLRDPLTLNKFRSQAEGDVRAGSSPPGSLSNKTRPSGLHDTFGLVVTSQPGAGQLSIIGGDDVVIEAPPRMDSLTETGRTSLLADCETLGYDAALMEDYHSPSLLLDNWASSVDEDTIGGATRSESESPNRTLVSTTEDIFSTVDEWHRLRHRRNTSAGSNASSTNDMAETLRTRSKTNEGLLKFTTNSLKLRLLKPARIHRRKVSLRIPVRPATSQPDRSQTTPSSPAVTNTLAPTLELETTRSATQTELLLQYKYRHIFIGTASLYTFLALLETLPTRPTTTSKSTVMKAFATLASTEQLTFRQASSSTEDWNLVTRITPDICVFDCVTLARVQLGSVSLGQFLELVPFGEGEQVEMKAVVEAWKNASFVDAEAGLNNRSKARAFRALVVGMDGAAE